VNARRSVLEGRHLGLGAQRVEVGSAVVGLARVLRTELATAAGVVGVVDGAGGRAAAETALVIVDLEIGRAVAAEAGGVIPGHAGGRGAVGGVVFALQQRLLEGAPDWSDLDCAVVALHQRDAVEVGALGLGSGGNSQVELGEGDGRRGAVSGALEQPLAVTGSARRVGVDGRRLEIATGAGPNRALEALEEEEIAGHIRRQQETTIARQRGQGIDSRNSNIEIIIAAIADNNDALPNNRRGSESEEHQNRPHFCCVG